MYKIKKIVTITVISGITIAFSLASLNNSYVKVKQGPAYNEQTEYVWK